MEYLVSLRHLQLMTPNMALQPTRYGVSPLAPGHALRAFWPDRSWRHAFAVG
jgi:hypothetical protein